MFKCQAGSPSKLSIAVYSILAVPIGADIGWYQTVQTNSQDISCKCSSIPMNLTPPLVVCEEPFPPGPPPGTIHVSACSKHRSRIASLPQGEAYIQGRGCHLPMSCIPGQLYPNGQLDCFQVTSLHLWVTC